MKIRGCFLLVWVLMLASCTSNTIYKKPKNLIPKDSMVTLLTDMYIASSAKNKKNKFLKREKNYMILVYEKYKIDSTRFDESNAYYTSKIDDYTDMLKEVKSRIDSLFDTYELELATLDSIQKLEVDSLNNKEEARQLNKDISKKLKDKNSKLKDSLK